MFFVNLNFFLIGYKCLMFSDSISFSLIIQMVKLNIYKGIYYVIMFLS